MILNEQVRRLRQQDTWFPKDVPTALDLGIPGEVSAAGPLQLLGHRITGFFCSSKCPGSIVLTALDTITRMRDEGRVLIGGFHSAMEWECLSILLRGRQPIIWVPARSLVGMRLHPKLVPAFDAGRLLILSPFGAKYRRATASLAEQRNHFIATVTDSFFIPHAAAGGKTAALARGLLAQCKEVCTISDPSNHKLIAMGAIPIDSLGVAREAARKSVSTVI